MNVVGIIPARVGSKGVPGKNKKMLAGKPLIQWTIEAAINARSISTVIVTSDDPNILELAVSMGVIAQQRPDFLATDDCQLDDVYLYTVRKAEADGYLNKDGTALAFLAATSPFRNSDDIDTAVGMYINYYRNFGMPATIVGMYWDYHFHWRTNYNNGSGEYNNLNPGVLPIYHDPLKRLGRQWTQDWLFTEAGNIYITDARQFLLRRSVRLEPFIAYVMPQERCIEIDSPLDWQIAEVLAPKFLGVK